MQIGIRYKLFFTLLLTTLVVVSGMMLFVQWSLDRGFVRYINTRELQQLQPLVDVLQNQYAIDQSWNVLTQNPRRWHRLLRNELESIHGRPGPDRIFRDQPPPPGMKGKPGPPKPPPPAIHRRLCLLDADKNILLLGDPRGPRAKDDPLLTAITYNDEVVGYLGLNARRDLSEANDLRFLEGQSELFLVIGLAVLVIAAAISLPIAQSLVSPIRQLHRAARKLAAGEYGEQIKVRSNDEVGALAHNFNQLSQTLKETQQARQQWAADIAHELRTPLAILQGEVEAIQDGVRTASSDNIVSLHKELLRLNGLVDDLYQLSLADIGALDYRMEPLDLYEVLGECVEAMLSRFAQKGIELTVDNPAADAIPINADASRLQQLFTNLLENSFRYTSAPGQLRVSVRKTDGEIEIRFADSAPSVSIAECGKLFERLYRADASRSRESGGAGLGLSICKSIVAAHQGTLRAQPSDLGGLEIIIVLPENHSAVR